MCAASSAWNPPDRVLDVVRVLPHHGLDQMRADVARHHDHRVLEIHRAALAVGQAAIVEHLQQHVEDVRVGFFHLVEQQHGDTNQMVFAVEKEPRQRLAQLGFAHARGAEEQKAARGAVRVRQTRTRAADGVGHSGNRLVLAHHALVQLGFHQEQLVALALHHLGDRNAGGAAHHFGDFLGAHLRAQQPVGRVGACAGFLVLRFL